MAEIGVVKYGVCTGELAVEAEKNARLRSDRTHVYHPRIGIVSIESAAEHVRHGTLAKESFLGHPDEHDEPGAGIVWPEGTVAPVAAPSSAIDYDALADAMVRAQERARKVPTPPVAVPPAK